MNLLVPKASMQFNGTTGFVALPSNNSFQATTGLTLCAWMNFSGTQVNNALVVYGPDYRLIFGSTAATLSLQLGTVNNAFAATSVTSGNMSKHANKWRHIAVTYDGATGLMYVDGARFAVGTTVSGNILTPNNNAGIGRDVTAQRWYAGKLANLGMWKRALSQNEIVGVRRGVAIPPNSLMAFYQLNQALGTTALDISANALNGTLSGSPTPILTPDVPRLLRPRRQEALR